MEKNLGIVKGTVSQGEAGEGAGEEKTTSVSVVVSSRNMISQDEATTTYGDHSSGRHYKVDFSKRTVVGVEDAKTDGASEQQVELSKLIGSGISKYLAEFFSKMSHHYGSSHFMKYSLRMDRSS